MTQVTGAQRFLPKGAFRKIEAAGRPASIAARLGEIG
jgi:hypothetical protein